MRTNLFFSVFMSVFVSVCVMQAALAAQSDVESASPGIIATVIFGLPLFYAGNKWRRWHLGFRYGSARGGRFLSAILWTVGALAWIAVGVLSWTFFESAR